MKPTPRLGITVIRADPRTAGERLIVVEIATTHAGTVQEWAGDESTLIHRISTLETTAWIACVDRETNREAWFAQANETLGSDPEHRHGASRRRRIRPRSKALEGDLCSDRALVAAIRRDWGRERRRKHMVEMVARQGATRRDGARRRARQTPRDKGMDRVLDDERERGDRPAHGRRLDRSPPENATGQGSPPVGRRHQESGHGKTPRHAGRGARTPAQAPARVCDSRENATRVTRTRRHGAGGMERREPACECLRVDRIHIDQIPSRCDARTQSAEAPPRPPKTPRKPTS